MFRKSSYSGMDGNNCVEVAHTAVLVVIRDSKAPRGVVRFGPTGFGRFLGAVRAGRFGLD